MVFGNFLKQIKSKYTVKKIDLDFSPKLAKKLAKDCVKHAKETHNVILDYSPASLKKVDNILYEHYPDIRAGVAKRRIPTKIKNIYEQLLSEYTSYQGELLIKAFGGKWVIEPKMWFVEIKKNKTTIQVPVLKNVIDSFREDPKLYAIYKSLKLRLK
jgi:hypothetical protein